MADSPPSATSRIRKPTEPKTTPKPKAPSLSKSALQDKIAEQVTFAGTMLGMGDPVGGFILLTNADMFAESWAEVAAVNPRVKRMLESWFSTSVYANCAAATAAIALPLTTHYGLLPRAWFNPARAAVAHMENLVAEGATLGDLMKIHDEARKEQQKMADAMAEAMRDMNGSAPEPEPDHYEAPTGGTV